MGRRRWWLLAVFLLGWLLLGSTCETVRETQIVSFEITPNPVVAGGSVFVAWQAEYVGLQDGGPYCTLQRSFEGGPAEALEVVPCIGWRTDEIGAATEAQYVNYRFSALRRTGQSYETEVVQVAITHVDVGVTVLPESVTLAPGGSQVFTATVSGASDSSVTWAATCGSISGSGSTVTYTAPASVGTCEVTVASVADPDASATASVTVTPTTALEVSVEPSSVSLQVNEAQSFTATITGTSDTSVTWSATCGSISGSENTVTYTAPASVPEPPTCVVTATSQADTSASDSAVVTVAYDFGTVLWTRQFGTSSDDGASSVAVDGSGNVVVAGYTFGSLEGVNAGAWDAFVRKYDAAGSVLWTRQFGTSDFDGAYGVAVDGSGNVVVAGQTGGALEGVNAGVRDAFVRKYDADGSVLWTQQFGTSGGDYATGVVVDGSGNVVVVGETGGSLEGVNAGGRDVFVRKYDAEGNEIWTRQFGTNDSESAGGVAVDGSGNVVVAGWTDGSLEGVNAGGLDVFVRKYGAAGNVLWTRQFGTNEDEYVPGVTVDGSGNVVVAGYTFGSLDGVSAGDWDAFVRKFDAVGNVLWTRQFGTSEGDGASGVAVDEAGNVVVTGHTGGALAGANTGGADAFVRKYDAAGSVLWTRQFGTIGWDNTTGVAVDGSGNVVVAGRTDGSLEGVNAGGLDAFVQKYAPW